MPSRPAYASWDELTQQDALDKTDHLIASRPVVVLELPLGWFLLDMAKNAMIYVLIRGYPQQASWAPLLGAITTMKLGLLLFCIAAIATIGWRRWRSISA